MRMLSRSPSTRVLPDFTSDFLAAAGDRASHVNLTFATTGGARRTAGTDSTGVLPTEPCKQGPNSATGSGLVVDALHETETRLLARGRNHHHRTIDLGRNAEYGTRRPQRATITIARRLLAQSGTGRLYRSFRTSTARKGR